MMIRWVTGAAADLAHLYEDLAQNTPETADSEAEAVLEAVKRLGNDPDSGRPGWVSGTRELVVAPYIVTYRVTDGAIQVLRLLHITRKWLESTIDTSELPGTPEEMFQELALHPDVLIETLRKDPMIISAEYKNEKFYIDTILGAIVLPDELHKLK